VTAWDCAIIGAGPAGATAAYRLASDGHSVLLLERESLPRVKPCGGGVSPAIASWFDFDFTAAIACRLDRVRFTWKQGDPVETVLNVDEPMWMVRRDRFDALLVERARDRGVEVRDRAEVTALDPRGVSLTVNGETVRARYAIAADGARGQSARWLGLPAPTLCPAAVLDVPVASVEPCAHFYFGAFKNGFLWRFPYDGGYTVNAAILRGKGKARDLEQAIAGYVKATKLDAGNASCREFPLAVWSDRPLHSQRALLVGDAAGVGDPLTAEGIRPAVLSGDRAARAVREALTRDDPNQLASYTATLQDEWGKEMGFAHKLAGIFHQFPGIAYRVGLKRPTAAQLMSQILCGQLSYGDVSDRAIKRIRSSLIPGRN